MNDETLEQLLRRADAGGAKAPPSVSTGDLLAAVRRRRMRRAGLRAGAAAAVVAAAILGRRDMMDPGADSGAGWSLKRPVQSASVQSVDANDLRRDLARLERDAEMHLRIVRGLTEQPAAPEIVATLGTSAGDAELVQIEAARSAALSWQYANLVETDLDNPAAARREYQRVAERFPGTKWANLAAVSLERLSQAADPSSL